MIRKIFCAAVFLLLSCHFIHAVPDTDPDSLTDNITLVTGQSYNGTLCFNTGSDLVATIKLVSDAPDRKLTLTFTSADVTLYDYDLWFEAWRHQYRDFQELEIVEAEQTDSGLRELSIVLEEPGVYYLSCHMPDDSDHYSASVGYSMTCSIYQGNQVSGIEVPAPYVRTLKYLNKTSSDYLETVDFHDGLGFVDQTHHRDLIESSNDVIELYGYDGLGRLSQLWNPVSLPSDHNVNSREEVVSSARSFYQDAMPFVYNGYERSARDRISSEFAQGERWHYEDGGHGITCSYYTNNASDLKCRKLRVLGSREMCSLADSGYYAAGMLRVRRMVDADAHVTYEFKDLQDRVLMSRVVTTLGNEDTYYVYDRFGNLCYVLPATVTSSGQSLTLSDDSDLLASNAYIYKYDRRNRCILKKLPGVSSVEYFYDVADRLVFWQDGWASQRGLMHFVFNDVHGRQVVEGTCTALTDVQKNYVRTNNIVASRSASDDSYGYTLPMSLSSVILNSVNYYDDYSFLTSTSVSSDFTGLGYVSPSDLQKYSQAYSISACKGALTGRLERIIGGTGQREPSVYYYDEFGNKIQEARKDVYGRIIRIQSRYDLAGNLLNSLEIVSSGNTEDTYASRYTWNKGSLLSSTNYNLCNKAYAGTAYIYDPVGRLFDIQTASSDFDRRHEYDVQNRVVSRYDYFYSENISFVDDLLPTSVPSWSGRVAEARSVFTDGSAPSSNSSRYSYDYDVKGQLINSECYLNESAVPSGCRSEKNMTYDEVGNLLAMQRKGASSSSLSSIINTYSGNRLMSVQIGSEEYGFSYDLNGNMTYDGLHDLEITYNHLNLIERISRNDTVLVNYCYLADGTKVSALDGDGDGLLYRGSLTYRKEGDGISLESASYDQGRIVADPSAYNGYRVLVHIPDHLGNVRVVADEEGNVYERNNYYPFGLRWSVGSDLASNRYRFNGKEEQSVFGVPYIDYGARQYDPLLARWSAPDPLSEKYYGISPYAYCANDPVNLVDLDGRDIWEINSQGVISWIESNLEHRLYALNAEGVRTSHYVMVSDRSILDALSGETGLSSYTTGSNIDDIFKVFLFAADNSDVEWAVHRGRDNMYTIGTSHKEDSAGSWNDYGINKPIASLHSHPGVSDEFVAELESMGYFDDILLGDRANVVNDVDVNGRQTRYNYVYFKNTGHLYHVEYYKPRFIKSVRNYRQFYFGTLNHQ